MEIRPAEMEEDRVAEALAVPLAARHPIDPPDPRVHQHAASFGQSIATASRNAVNREPDTAYGVVARAGLASLRVARLAAVLADVPDPAGRDEACRCVMAHTNA
jgi:hypothetical protein